MISRRSYVKGLSVITAVGVAGCGDGVPNEDLYAVVEYPDPPDASTTWKGILDVDDEERQTIHGGSVDDRKEYNVGRADYVLMSVYKADRTTYDLWIGLGTDETTLAEDETDEPQGKAEFKWER